MSYTLKGWGESGSTELPDDFLLWLGLFLPQWEYEYSGVIYGLFKAFEAGKLAGRYFEESK
jgi:hypothetical protein